VAQLFPKWTNKLPTFAAVVAAVVPVLVVGFVWYYFSPWYTDVGYRPDQPVKYSHKLHVDKLGLDCRYCHSSVEKSAHANVPPTATCMNCHKLVGTENERLLPVRESFAKDVPIKWVRVHDLPDYCYFEHSLHLRAGVGCSSCHGNVAEMEVVSQRKPLSMSWCLDCHRDPRMAIRRPDQITNTRWEPPADQLEYAAGRIRELGIKPPVTDCSGCHR
jgi:hypothetical protein